SQEKEPSYRLVFALLGSTHLYSARLSGRLSSRLRYSLGRAPRELLTGSGGRLLRRHWTAARAAPAGSPSVLQAPERRASLGRTAEVQQVGFRECGATIAPPAHGQAEERFRGGLDQPGRNPQPST